MKTLADNFLQSFFKEYKEEIHLKDKLIIKDLSNENKKLSSLVIHHRDVIKCLTDSNENLEKEIKKLQQKKTAEDLKIFNELLLPQILASHVAKDLSLPSSKTVNQLAEKYGLFDSKNLVIRIPRITQGNQAKKHETLVLFSRLGVFVLRKLIELATQKAISNAKPMVEEKKKSLKKKITVPKKNQKFYSEKEVFSSI